MLTTLLFDLGLPLIETPLNHVYKISEVLLRKEPQSISLSLDFVHHIIRYEKQFASFASFSESMAKRLKLTSISCKNDVLSLLKLARRLQKLIVR